MKIEIDKTPGINNEMLLTISRHEIDHALFSIANPDKFMGLCGLKRHQARQDPEKRAEVNRLKVPVEKHLELLSEKDANLLDESGRPVRRIVAVGSRNVGNNHGFVAWRRDGSPRFFHILEDPLNFPFYTCLTREKSGDLRIRPLRFENDRVFENGEDVTDMIDWCVFGNQVLENGSIACPEDSIEQYYDIRHILAFDRQKPEGARIENMIYEGYPDRFRENALKAFRELGVPRNVYFHNALGMSDDDIFILQKEGTPELVADRLRRAGAKDAVILDNGGSVFCWAWWLNSQGPFQKAGFAKGGYLFNAPDFRPPSSAVVVFVLKGSAATHLPGGSASFLAC